MVSFYFFARDALLQMMRTQIAALPPMPAITAVKICKRLDRTPNISAASWPWPLVGTIYRRA